MEPRSNFNPTGKNLGVEVLNFIGKTISKNGLKKKPTSAPIFYPESDGKPMADNTKQYEWISKIKWELENQYREDKNVFVAGDLLWYPKEGDNKTRIAPDAMVAFGRPKKHRGSYKQWEENGIAPQVVFEVWSPGNKKLERVAKKFDYESYGVDEYYEYDPDNIILKGWIRDEFTLKAIPEMEGWVSPRLGIRFEMKSGELKLFHPDGSEFVTPLGMAEKTEVERQRAERAELLVINEQKEKLEEKQRADLAEQRAELLTQKLKELGINL